MSRARPTDLYAILRVDAKATAARVREAFRKRLLELHPDKGTEAPDPDLLDDVMRAFDVLGNPRRREEYDDLRERCVSIESKASDLPHVTESKRPIDQARSILYWLLEQDYDAAFRRLRTLDDPIDYLHAYLDDEEFIDSCFLLAEELERRDQPFESLGWFQALLSCERKRRRHRPCYGQAIARTKRLLIQVIGARVSGRTALEYLRRAETLGLERSERVEVHKRRAQCYLELDMKANAAAELERALRLQPQLKGVTRLREQLADYL